MPLLTVSRKRRSVLDDDVVEELEVLTADRNAVLVDGVDLGVHVYVHLGFLGHPPVPCVHSLFHPECEFLAHDGHEHVLHRHHEALRRGASCACVRRPSCRSGPTLGFLLRTSLATNRFDGKVALCGKHCWEECLAFLAIYLPVMRKAL